MKVFLFTSLLVILVIVFEANADVETTAIRGVVTRPPCRPGYSLSLSTCQCSRITTSTCSTGYSRMIKSGDCKCQRRISPRCSSGVLNSRTCQCRISSRPTCSSGATLSILSTAVCTRYIAPYCQAGYVKKGCQCVRQIWPQCTNGALSNNKCSCCGNSYTPTCPGAGRPRPGCTCLPPSRIQCYYNTGCTGSYRTVSTTSQCCRGSAHIVEEEKRDTETMVADDAPTDTMQDDAPTDIDDTYPISEDDYTYSDGPDIQTDDYIAGAEMDLMEAMESKEGTIESTCRSYRKNGRCYNCS